MNVNPRIRQHGDDHAAPPARGVIPFSEMTRSDFIQATRGVFIDDNGLIRARRRHRTERGDWNVHRGEVARLWAWSDVKEPDPYLVAHPEREIAEARNRVWTCEACRTSNAFIGFTWTEGEALGLAIRDAHRHNAERHPRRWARSQNFSGTVALDEARRVTRWGADA